MDANRADGYRNEGLWRSDLLTDHVREHVRNTANRTALVDDDGTLTWSELWALTQRSAAALAERGVARKDIVSTQLPNARAIVVLHLAIELLGGVHNPLAMQFREHELDQLSRLLNSRLVVHPGQVGDIDYAAIHGQTTSGRSGVSVAADQLVGEHLPLPHSSVERSTAAATDMAFILNTSGTVSIKGVMHSHEEALYSTRTVAGLIELNADDTVLCAIPMTWGGGLAWGLRVALHVGATLVCLKRWDASAASHVIDEAGVTYTYGPPTMARDLVALSDAWRPNRPIRMICAGAPIPRQLCLDARDKLGLRLVPGYGQTEHLHSTLGRLDDPDAKLTTDGRALPGVEIRAVGANGEPCGPGEAGALECRGPNVSLGYFGQPDLTAQFFRPDGWQVTQDLGSFDAQGYLSVVGRQRDIIIRGGLNVSPREVEELLLRHPDIKDAAVVGYPDERYGERICAFVVPASTAVVSVDEVSAAFAEMGVARYKHPERIEAIGALPLTTTGKVRHETLRERLRAGEPTGGSRSADSGRLEEEKA